MPPTRILVLDDEDVVQKLLQRLLAKMAYEPHQAESVSRARDFLAANPGYDLLIVDLRLPDGRGDDFIMEFQSGNPSGKVLVISGHPDLERDIPFLRARGMGCLSKPFRDGDLRRMVRALLGKDAVGEAVS